MTQADGNTEVAREVSGFDSSFNPQANILNKLSRGTNEGSSSQLTVQYNNPSEANFLLVFTRTFGITEEISATYGGQSLTKHSTINNEDITAGLFYLFNPPSGSNSLVINYSTDGGNGVMVYSIADVDSIRDISSQFNNHSSINPTTVTVNTQTNDLVINYHMWRNSHPSRDTSVPGSNQSFQLFDDNPFRQISTSKVGGASNTSMSQTHINNHSSNRFIHFGISLNLSETRRMKRGGLFFDSTGLSTSSNTDWYIYYGNPAATEPVESSIYGKNNVWDEDYVGVWHLNEKSGGSNSIKDSTSNLNHGTDVNIGDLNLGIDGKTGFAPSFSGDGVNASHVEVPHHSSLAVNNGLTIQTWMRPTNFGQSIDSGVVGKARGTGVDYCCAYSYGIRLNPSNVLRFDTPDGLTQQWLWGDSPVSNNTWTKVTITYDGSNKRIYINNQQDKSIDATGSITYPAGNDPLRFGRIYGDGSAGDDDRRYQGMLDEIRISKIARSFTWIQTDYNNQNSPETFWTVGSQEQ